MKTLENLRTINHFDRDFPVARKFREVCAFKLRISRICDAVRFTIRGTVIYISSRSVSLYPLLYRPSFFSARAPWRFFSSSWPVLVRYPWKPNRGPSVSLMENRRRRTEGWPLGRRCRSTFHAQGKILVRVRIAPTRVNILCWRQSRELQLLSSNLKISEIEKIAYCRIYKLLKLTSETGRNQCGSKDGKINYRFM